MISININLDCESMISEFLFSVDKLQEVQDRR